MKTRKIVILPIAFLLIASCAGFPSRAWIKDTRNMKDSSSKERIDKIVRDFNKINPEDRIYAIQTLAKNLSPVGQEALLASLDNETIRKDPVLKKLVVNEIKKRKEKNTPEGLLNKSLQHTELLDENTVPYIQKELGNKAVASITKAFLSKPQELSPAVVDYLTEENYEPARKVILEGISKNPDLVDNGVASYFSNHIVDQAPESFFNAVQQKPSILQNEKVPELFLKYKFAKAAPFLLNNAQKKPDWTSGSLLLYFGTVKYTDSVAFIKEKIDKKQFIEPAIHSLYLMDDYNLNIYILALSRDPDQQIRLQSLRNLVLISDKRIRKKADPDFRGILQNHKKESSAINLAGISFYKRSPYQTRVFELLKNVYKKNNDKKTRTRALEVMASMKKTSLSRMLSLLKGNLRGADVGLVKRRVFKPKTVKTRKVKKNKRYSCSVKKKYPASWNKKLQRMFNEQFDKDLAVEIKRQINNALITYASSNNSNSKLIRRAYKKSLNLEEDLAKKAMKKGIRYPGSLSVIVWQINSEYKTDDMRIYALASIFGIDRWKSAEIINMVRKKCL